MKRLPAALENHTGTYALILRLNRDRAVSIGRLDSIDFPAGFYIYIGSAFGPGGLRTRLGRHISKRKRSRWHIDYLRRLAELVEIWYTLHPEKAECRWAEVIRQTRHTRIPCPGFGASDCRCGTHLFHFESKPGLKTFRRKVKMPVRLKGMQS